MSDQENASPTDADVVSHPARRGRKRPRKRRTIVGSWAAAGTQSGSWLGTAFAGTALAVPLVVGLAEFASSGNLLHLAIPHLSKAGGVATFYLMVTVFALVTGWVIGSISGLAIGVVNGLVLWVLSRTAVFRSAAPAGRHRLAMAAVVVSTAGAWVAAQGAWLGVRPDLGRAVVVYLPAAAGGVVAARLSRKLPPVRT